MRIACPHCGDRSLEEFAYHGDAAPVRPDAGAGIAAFVEYAYVRANPAGPVRELWYHAAGCRAYLVVTRNTVTHAILGVEYARDAALRRGGGA